MQPYIIIGSIPFLLSIIVLIISNKFSPEIKSALKDHFKRSLLCFVVFAATALMEYTAFPDTESRKALNHFLLILSVILLFWCFAIQAATIVMLIIKCRKSKNYSDITLSALPELLLNEYRNLDSILKENNKDERTYPQRLKAVVLPSITLVFMYFIFGMCESYFANKSEWAFIFMDIFPTSLIFSAILIILLCAAAYFIKGKNLDMMVLIITALCVMSYIQNAFLNINVFIDGNQKKVSDAVSIFNLLIWLSVVILIPYIICSCKKIKIKKLLYGCSAAAALLLIMQGSALSYILINGLSEPQSRERTGYALSGAEQFEVSTNENVIVFIMDTYYSGFFDNWLEEHPEYYDTFSDFIYFDDVNTETTHTVFSMPSLMTAHEPDYTISLIDSNTNCWNSDEADFFYSSMHDDGYTVRFYTDNDKYAGGAKNMLGKIDNVYEYSAEYYAKKLPTYFSMTMLSAYKYLPLSIKDAFFISDSYEINQYTVSDSDLENIDMVDWRESSKTSKSRGIDFYNFDYYDSLLKNGLTTTDKKLCIFQHIFGMHTPFISSYYNSIDSQTRIDEEVAQEGCMAIFTTYISQLKEIGVYDNSTIILTADHGTQDFNKTTPIMLIKPQGRTNDRLVKNSAPGNLQTDLLPTILDSIELEYGPLEYSLMRIDEDMQRERTFLAFNYSTDFPNKPKCEGVGISTYNYYSEYKYTGRCSEADFESMEPRKYPITDYWW